MADHGGYFVIWREGWLWDLPPGQFKTAILLIEAANWKDSSAVRGGRKFTVKRGQLLLGQTKFAERVGITRSSLRRALDVLQAAGFLTRSATHHFTLVTITNYDKYQMVPGFTGQQPTMFSASDPAMSHPSAPANGPATSNTVIQECKNTEGSKPPGWASLSGKDKKVLYRHLDVSQHLWRTQDLLRKETGLRCNSLKGSASALVRVAKILEGGHDKDDCMAVLKRYRDEAMQSKDLQWFDGVTNWRPENFDRALGKVGSAGTPEPYQPRLYDPL